MRIPLTAPAMHREKTASDKERRRKGSETYFCNDFFSFFGFAFLNTMTCANYFCVFCYDWTGCHGAYAFESHSRNVVESEQSNDRQESLNCHCEGLLICFLKEISQK